jgi:hypothetical protein
MTGNSRQTDELHAEGLLLYPANLSKFDKQGLGGLGHEYAHPDETADEYGALARDETAGKGEVGNCPFTNEWSASEDDWIGDGKSVI